MHMDSWWRLGDGAGFHGKKLALDRIECAFCGESGHFELAFHGEKRKPTSAKTLNFDVYRCTNCAGYVHVLWACGEDCFLSSSSMHNYQVLPWPLGAPKPSNNWSAELSRFWVQAHKALKSESWDAASAMARSALQLALREHTASGRRLVDQVNDLATKSILPPTLKEWATEVRLLGNDAAHPEPGQAEPEPQDVQQVVDFLDYLLTYLYDLPAEIKQYRARRTKEP